MELGEAMKAVGQVRLELSGISTPDHLRTPSLAHNQLPHPAPRAACNMQKQSNKATTVRHQHVHITAAKLQNM